MNLAVRLIFVLVFGAMVTAAAATPARAIEATETPDTYWLQDTALKIAGYRRSDDGKDMRYLEVFNSSGALLDMSQWRVTGVFGDGVTTSRAQLDIRPLQPGRLAPGHHAVVQVVDEVSHASFDGGAWVPAPGPTMLLTSLEVSAAVDGWRTDVYVLKTATDAQKKPVYGDYYVRAQTGSQDYTATLSSFSAQTPVLYDDGLYVVPEDFPGSVVEVYPNAKDCEPNAVDKTCSDYVKLHIDEDLDLSQYVLRVGDDIHASRTNTNTFYLSDFSLTTDGYLTVSAEHTGTKMNLTNGGYVWLEDVYGEKVYDATLVHYEPASSKQQAQAYAWVQGTEWAWTTTPQPDGPNRIVLPVEATQEIICPAGKYLNPDTGRCRTIEEAVSALAACPEGQERNPATNRCRAKATATTETALKPCGEGQERNPLTNRCRSIASAVAELLPCDEGYERNPETNRCRKVLGAATTMASQHPTAETAAANTAQRTSAQWGVWTLAIVAAGVAGYGVYEWREDLAGSFRKIAARFAKPK